MIKTQIKNTIQAWLDHQERIFEAAGMKLEDDIQLRSLPDWPTRRQLKEWVRGLECQK